MKITENYEAILYTWAPDKQYLHRTQNGNWHEQASLKIHQVKPEKLHFPGTS